MLDIFIKKLINNSLNDNTLNSNTLNDNTLNDNTLNNNSNTLNDTRIIQYKWKVKSGVIKLSSMHMNSLDINSY